MRYRIALTSNQGEKTLSEMGGWGHNPPPLPTLRAQLSSRGGAPSPVPGEGGCDRPARFLACFVVCVYRVAIPISGNLWNWRGRRLAIACIRFISFCLCFSVHACMADSLCLFALVCLVTLSKQKRNQQAAPRRRADEPVSESVAVDARHAVRPSIWYREIEGGS